MNPPTMDASGPRGKQGSSTEAPLISVLVTAHDRRRYLTTAVESVLGQTLPRQRFEILVVKNFEDKEIDRFLAERGVAHWVTAAGPLSAKLDEARSHARGQVVAFLEDDDRYRPERLATIAAAFSEDPTLGFFRNGFDVIDEEGRPFRGSLSEAVRTSLAGARDLVVRDADKEEQHRALIDALPDFNTSTMAIRRDLLDAAAPWLRRLESGVDRFLFYTALVSPRTLRLDRRRLTEYRVHSENTGISVVRRTLGTRRDDTGSEMLARVDRIMANDRADEKVLYELVRSSPRRSARRELEGRLLVAEVYHKLREASVDRRGMLRLLRQFPGYRATQPVRVNHPLAFEGAVYVVSPSLARRFHRRHLNRWVGIETPPERRA